MTTYVNPEIDWSTFPDRDDEPLAENLENAVQMMDLIVTLKVLLRTQGRTRYVVGGNQFLYYNRLNGRDHIAPDVYVGFDVEPGGRPSWQTWVEGKAPDIVWEITSESTQDEDLGHKRVLYARIGVREYYIHDPLDGLRPLFRGYTYQEGREEQLPVLPTGGILSPLLGAELRPMAMEATQDRPAAMYLRVIGPRNGAPFSGFFEIFDDRDDVRRKLDEMTREFADVRRITEEGIAAERQRADAAQQRADSERQRADDEARLRVVIEQRADAEARARVVMEQRMDVEVRLRQAHEQARRVAEEQAAQATAALRAALARIERLQGGDGAPEEGDV